MDPKKKSVLMQFTTAVKAVIYDAKRMADMLPMLDTKAGAIQAVQAVLSAIERKKPIPPGIVPLLAVNTYMLMVDMAREITGQEPDPAIVNGVTQELLATMEQSYGQQAQTEQQGQTAGPPPGPGQMPPPANPAGGGLMAQQKAMV